MRRWWAVATTGVLVAALLTGCGGPAAGTDGDLTDEWGSPPAPTSFTPQAGTCHRRSELTGSLATYAPVDCAKAHRVETVHVGTFTGASAGQPATPKPGNSALRSAFADCDARARQFVGGDWRGGRLSVRLVPPSPPGWMGGNRWYRCDLFQTTELEGSILLGGDPAIERIGSLRAALAKPGPLAETCSDYSKYGDRYHVPVPCGKPHRFEYAGTWTSPEKAYAMLERDVDGIHSRCRSVIARYVNVFAPDLLRLGTMYRVPSEEEWSHGDRGIRCFLYSANRQLTRSLKNAGPAALRAS